MRTGISITNEKEVVVRLANLGIESISRSVPGSCNGNTAGNEI